MNDEEKNFNNLIDDLKNLPQINAPQNFEADLWRKIKSSESEKKEKFWDKIFTPGKLIPAGVAIASAVIIFFIIDIKPTEIEDPLNLQPRLREDLIVVEKIEEKNISPADKPQIKTNEKRKLSEDKTEVQSKPSESDNGLMLSKEGSEIKDQAIDEEPKVESLRTEPSQRMSGNISPGPEAVSASELKKDNLNFMQINLSAKEKQEVERLKQRMQSSEKPKSE